MPKIIKIIVIIFIEFSFLFLIIIVLPTIFIRERSGINQISYSEILPLDINHTYVQPIITNRDNLNAVSVQLKNPGLNSYDVVYVEIQNNLQETLKELSFTGRSIGDPSWINFKFPYIESKVGDKIYLKVSSNALKDNLLYIYGNPQSKDINFKSTYKTKTIKLSFIENFLNQKNRFFESNKLQLISYLFILVVINILIISTL